MTTVYDLAPSRWDEIAKTWPSVAKMARHFENRPAMERELGFMNTGAIRHWIEGTNKISQQSEAAAKNWLAANAVKEAPAPSGDGLLLVVCGDKLDKVRRVLGLMGCEMVDM